MGIKKLRKFLQDKHPQVFEEVHISQFQYKKVAVDISCYVHKYKHAVYNEEHKNEYKYLEMFIRFLGTMRENNIHCIFVYDKPKGAPKEKEAEQKKRRVIVDTARAKLEKLIFDFEQYQLTGEISPFLLEIQKGHEIPSLLPGVVTLNEAYIRAKIASLGKQVVPITARDFQFTKEILGILNIPFIESYSESEKTCAELCIKGMVDAVMSEDTDLMAHGCPLLLSKLDTTDGLCCSTTHAAILEALELTENQFLDFCIMCGTDYNLSIPKVGAVTSYNLIKKHGSIEKVGKNTHHDVNVFNAPKTRLLLKQKERIVGKVPYCGRPNMEKLEKFLKINGLFLQERYLSSFQPKIRVVRPQEQSDRVEKSVIKVTVEETEEEEIILEDD